MDNNKTDHDDSFNAIYLSKAESRSKWSFIGILLPPLGIILGILGFITANKIKGYRMSEVANIKATSIAGIIISIISIVISINLMNRFFDNFERNLDTTYSEESDQDTAEKVVGQSEEAVFSSSKFRINSVTTVKSIKGEYSPEIDAGEGAKFLLINLTVTNISKEPFMYRSFDLIDGQGRKYESFDAIGSVDNYMDARDLAPSLPETGVSVYKVPVDAKEFKLGGLKQNTNESLYIKFNSN